MEKQPSGRHLSGDRPTAQDRIKGSDPPYNIKTDFISQRGYPQTRWTSNAWYQAYALARKPWIFVPLVGGYWAISITQLISKLSTFNVASFLLSSFVLAFAIMHNLVDVLDCLGTIFRQIGAMLRVVGRVFNITGRALRLAAKRLREAFSAIEHQR